MTLRPLPEIKAFRKLDDLGFKLPPENLESYDPGVVSAEDGQEGVISIYGQIGIDPMEAVDNTERRIGAALRAIGPREVTVNINSPGGNFFNGLAIYNLLRGHRAKVTVNVVGMAGSAASVIAMAGDEILMADGTHIMVHCASAIVMGNRFDTNEVTELLTEIDDAMAEVYAARSGADKTVAASWMDRNRGFGTMFGPTAAISKGLASGKLDPRRIQNAIAADAKKLIPGERIIERALMAAANMSDSEAKALIAGIKTGTREAAGVITREADDSWAAMARTLTETLKR